MPHFPSKRGKRELEAELLLETKNSSGVNGVDVGNVRLVLRMCCTVYSDLRVMNTVGGGGWLLVF